MKFGFIVDKYKKVKMKIIPIPDFWATPNVLIDAFSFIVLLAFSVLCIKNYRLNKNRKFLHLGLGFMLIAIAQLASILTKVVLYYNISFTQNIGQLVVTYDIVKSVDIFYYIGLFFFKFLTLSGLYVIYRLPRKRKSAGDLFLALYFIVLSAIFGTRFEYLFYITALILLVMIIGNYYDVYKKSRLANTAVLISAFSMLALSNVIFLPAKLDDTFFIAANIIELVSYLTLLLLMLRIVKHGKEKKQNGYSIGYVSDYPRKRG